MGERRGPGGARGSGDARSEQKSDKGQEFFFFKEGYKDTVVPSLLGRIARLDNTAGKIRYFDPFPIV